MSTTTKSHVILAILHGNSGLITLACTTCILQLQNYLAQKPAEWVVHVHMFKDEEELGKHMTLLACGQSGPVINIPKEIERQCIKLCVMPGEFGLEVEPMIKAIQEDIPQGTALAFPYPLTHYNFKAAVDGDTVKPEKAMVYNVPDARTGQFPEIPRLYVCTLPTFVGPNTQYTIFKDKVRITHTGPFAFVGCAGQRTGGSLR